VARVIKDGTEPEVDETKHTANGGVMAAHLALEKARPKDSALFGYRRAPNGRISVAVCEEHEILRAGLVASLNEDRALRVTAAPAEQIAETDVDVAIVSSKTARQERFRCPIVVCSDEPEAHGNAFVGNDVAGVLHRGSLTVSQLLATVHAAAAGLRVQAKLGDGSEEGLNPRALRVLELIAEGCSTREMAARMNYSERTIKKLITELEARLQARTRAQIVAHAIRGGLI
jgi:DNA-binding NarL/FixJ family response regulator